MCRHFRDDGLSLLHESQVTVIGLHPVSAWLDCWGPRWSLRGQQSRMASSCFLSHPSPVLLSPPSLPVHLGFHQVSPTSRAQHEPLLIPSTHLPRFLLLLKGISSKSAPSFRLFGPKNFGIIFDSSLFYPKSNPKSYGFYLQPLSGI